MVNFEWPRNNEDWVNLKSELLKSDFFPQKEVSERDDSLDINKRLSMSNFPQKTVKVWEKLDFQVVDKKGQKVDCSFDLTSQWDRKSVV